MMKRYYFMMALILAMGSQAIAKAPGNPFFVKLNTSIDYSKVTAADIEVYAQATINQAKEGMKKIQQNKKPDFKTVFVALDDMVNSISNTSNNCYMLYWVSPDSSIRAKGLACYQKMDELLTSLYSDKLIYEQMLKVKKSGQYAQLKKHEQYLVDDQILSFEQSGVNLDEKKLARFKKLTNEITQLSSNYSSNMNSAQEILVIDEQEAKGLPENFKKTYKTADNRYEIPVINATRGTVMSNAENEATRKAFYFKYTNIAADKNIAILDSLVKKRHELALIMGYRSFAEYSLFPKMAKNPETVWKFINDLVDRSKEKAKSDIALLRELKNNDPSNVSKSPLNNWDIAYYNNQILKTKYSVDYEKIREYLPMDQCLKGVFDIYQTLLGLEFKKVENAGVWHEEVHQYDVYDGDKLVGRFYLDLYPRPNKESWFYSVGIKSGKATSEGYEVPSSMLLGNFTRPTASMPSLLSFKELNTLFHEFGHIVNALSYNGEFSLQSDAKRDFIESMSQIFENWTMDYAMLSSFAKHYKTGEVLPQEIFDNMVKAKNVSSGYNTISSLRSCMYDMYLYDKYNPEKPYNTDELWKMIDKQLGVMDMYIDGTHTQASWIHINTHPVYYYGYLWSEVYAQDMFTEFEKNGLKDPKTGMRFRKLILSNGKQRDIIEAVEEFLGRPSNNEAYIKSLGLE